MAAPLSRSAAAAAAAAVAVATLLAALTGEVSAQRRGSRLASGAPSSSASNAAADFDCPEEFGYYPHPTDCTQYYVCVFGGALVESCTGGLMYSHELQTCDWPRNVGCGAGEGATVSTVRVTDPRTRQTTPSALPPSRAPVAISRGQQEQQRQQQEEIVKHQLYAEDVGPAEEVEIDRQQRVYRGQPSTLGQVQRDRDGLRHQPVNNVIPAPTGRASSGDKIAVISFGTQQQVQPAQYRVEPSNSYQPQPQSAVPTNPTIYNSSQQYDTAAQYDPYYNNYDEDVELYRDIDYGQYTGSQNNQQQPYRGNQNTYKTAPQPTAPQRTNSYVQPSYSSQDVYTQQQQPQQQQQQQDYSDSYNTQLSDEQYREPSRTPSRVRPTTASPESQTTPTPSRTPTVNRNRGSSPYVSNSGTDTVNRGTPASVRTRPTLKPSTAFVSKAQEFVDIYKYPPSRPAPVYPQPQVDKTAAKCRKDVCLLPDCFCGGKDIPGDLPVEQVPQIVLLTFDDSANDLNKGLYSDLFEKGRKNPNGCPIAATFYVSHEWTDYSHVQNLYASGHEIASHSISHSFGEQFSQKKWSKEIGGQREILAQYGGVRLEDVRGMRAPFLAIGGNKMFKMLYDLNFTYDSSMPVYENRPPSWPYTLDYKIFHDCMIPPCPTRSYPGVWEVPMVMWQDLNGGRCSMGDACSNPPTADGVYKMLIKNFERHYTTNRAPFGLFYHAAWFTQPHHKEGFEAFLDTIVAMDDVWLVTNWQAIQWVRQPTPLSEIKNFPPFQCNYADRPKKCNNPKVCNLWHKSGVRYMRTCQACPEVYPWTGKTGVKNSRIDNEIYEET
ncbi:uncharacterized protein LOC124615457 isoform X7 [Schistocerca americana]|uniref:uncharacterized protein LOC124615457 isoform X7 n=1 Tax=Schistocerca americana TaxID=7009 RepID=UPI001F4F914E|nr:uncharacterized protein LOC124615457 isoform X7 [Schistocerca americana]XP_049938362.1 uncharacterized protein LOC126412664 isoform X6 [Schistocerca serialis cubense]